MRRAVHYNFVALGGLLISITVLAALTYLLNIYYLFANFFAIGAATLWNYAVNYHWTWPATRRLVEEAAAILPLQTSEPTDKRKVD